MMAEDRKRPTLIWDEDTAPVPAPDEDLVDEELDAMLSTIEIVEEDDER